MKIAIALIVLAASIPALASNSFEDRAKACRAVGFQTADDITQCLSETGNKDSSIITACASVGFRLADDVHTCINLAQASRFVQTCGAIGYTSADDLLTCIGMAH